MEQQRFEQELRRGAGMLLSALSASSAPERERWLRARAALLLLARAIARRYQTGTEPPEGERAPR